MENKTILDVIFKSLHVLLYLWSALYSSTNMDLERLETRGWHFGLILVKNGITDFKN